MNISLAGIYSGMIYPGRNISWYDISWQEYITDKNISWHV
jgi:hypothetical protein